MQREIRPFGFFKNHDVNFEIYNALSEEDPEIKDLAESIERKGILEPLQALEDGTLLAGHRRLFAGRLAGLENFPVFIRPAFKTKAEEVEVLISLNMHRKKTAPEQWREGQHLLDALKGQHKGRKSDEIAARLGLGSGRQWQKLDYVMQHADDESKAALESGTVSIHGLYEALKAAEKAAERQAERQRLNEQREAEAAERREKAKAAKAAEAAAPAEAPALVEDAEVSDQEVAAVAQGMRAGVESAIAEASQGVEPALQNARASFDSAIAPIAQEAAAPYPAISTAPTEKSPFARMYGAVMVYPALGDDSEFPLNPWDPAKSDGSTDVHSLEHEGVRVPHLVAPNGVVLLWTVGPMVSKAIQTVAQWGLQFVTLIPVQTEKNTVLHGELVEDVAYIVLARPRGSEALEVENKTIFVPLRSKEPWESCPRRLIEFVMQINPLGPYLQFGGPTFDDYQDEGWEIVGNEAE